jgi:hypothetical protein
MLGDLPPSSSFTFLRLFAAARITALPVALDPVKVTMSTRSLAAMAWPTTAPLSRALVTTFSAPAGRPASSMMRANSITAPLDWCAGLITRVQPAASPGQALCASERAHSTR